MCKKLCIGLIHPGWNLLVLFINWLMKFERWTFVPSLIYGRSSCSNWSTSTISSHTSSCGEVVTSHATSIGHYSRYRWWLKDQNDELLQVIFLLELKLRAKWLPVITIKCSCFFRHTAYFLVAGDELKNPNQQIPCKHAAGKDNSWLTKLYKFSFVCCLIILTFNALAVCLLVLSPCTSLSFWFHNLPVYRSQLLVKIECLFFYLSMTM
jgi:hypothetical protein